MQSPASLGSLNFFFVVNKRQNVHAYGGVKTFRQTRRVAVQLLAMLSLCSPVDTRCVQQTTDIGRKRFDRFPAKATLKAFGHDYFHP
jgi:hypothetical protein